MANEPHACIAKTDPKKKHWWIKKLANGLLFAKFANFFPLQNFPTYGSYQDLLKYSEVSSTSPLIDTDILSML